MPFSHRHFHLQPPKSWRTLADKGIRGILLYIILHIHNQLFAKSNKWDQLTRPSYRWFLNSWFGLLPSCRISKPLDELTSPLLCCVGLKKNECKYLDYNVSSWWLAFGIIPFKIKSRTVVLVSSRQICTWLVLLLEILISELGEYFIYNHFFFVESKRIGFQLVGSFAFIWILDGELLQRRTASPMSFLCKDLSIWRAVSEEILRASPSKVTFDN